MRAWPWALAPLALLLAFGACGSGDPLSEIDARHAAGDFAGTIEPLRALLIENPDDPALNYRYGFTLAATGQNTLAAWPLLRAMEDPEWTVRAGILLAGAALATRDFNEVVEVTTRVLELEPDEPAALLLRAKAHAHWRKEPERALDDAERLLDLNPDSVEAMEPRILALLLLERTEEARSALRELGRRLDEVEAPSETRAWYCVTSTIFAGESGDVDFEQVRAMWNQCLAEHPAAADVVWAAIAFFDANGETERSLEVVQAAFERAPEVNAYRVMFADRLRLAGRSEEGEALLREGTESEDPAMAAQAWLDLSRFHKAAEDRVAAAEALERAIERTREMVTVPPQLRFEYADALVLADQLDRALEVAEELDVPAHRHVIRARVAQERGDPAAALAEFERAFRLWPDNPWTRWYAARAAEELGDFDRAIEEYRSAIRIESGATDARTRAARQLIAEGRLQAGRTILRVDPRSPLDLQGHLLNMWLAGLTGSGTQLENAFASLVGADPTAAAAGVAEAARGFAEWANAAAAIDLMRGAHAGVIDYTDPRDAAALRQLVVLYRAAGAANPPRELIEAMAKHPDASVFHAIRGLDLELAGDREGARRSYERALELAPDEPTALLGMGRVLAEGDPERAVEFFDRAAEAAPENSEPKLRAAQALVALGRRQDAAERLDAMLREHALDARAAMLRATLDLEQGVATAGTLERARRAVRFGGGLPALELLERVHAARGEQEEAQRVGARIERLRERAEQAAAPEEGAAPEGSAGVAPQDAQGVKDAGG